MRAIKSKTQEVNYSAQQVFNFLSDFHNFRRLLPPDKIENWQCTADTCSFTVSGMISLQLRINQKTPYSKVNYLSDPAAKYKFNLSIHIAEISAAQCSCTIEMEYDLNAFLNPVAEKPLTGLINMMVEKLAAAELIPKA